MKEQPTKDMVEGIADALGLCSTCEMMREAEREADARRTGQSIIEQEKEPNPFSWPLLLAPREIK